MDKNWWVIQIILYSLLIEWQLLQSHIDVVILDISKACDTYPMQISDISTEKGKNSENTRSAYRGLRSEPNNQLEV